MLIKLTDSNRYFRVFLIVIFVIYFNYGITAERIGYLYFNFLCYNNPDHYDFEGYSCDSLPSKNCDPTFKICISSQRVNSISKENCPFHFQETDSFDNAESVCKDNRGSLRSTIVKELPYIAESYFVTISIIDVDSWSSSITYIATFGIQFTQIPSKDKESPRFQDLNMYRLEHRYRNGKASMKISMALQCDYERYGKRCEQFCKPSNSYQCSNEGRKICTEGWKGEECDKRDLCLYQACITGAKCVEENNKAICVCNGISGPHCYPNYNPCLHNPCENNGQCIPNKTGEVGVRCSCNRPFYGPKCESKFDLCELEPCHNNATCEYDGNFKRRCICLTGYVGILCDHKINLPDESFTSNRTFNWTNYSLEAFANKNINTSQTGMTLMILFVLVIIVIITVTVVILFIRRNKKMKHLKSDTKISMLELENKLNAPKTVLNDYCVKSPNENIYDTVKEELTYAYLHEQNDGYLIPSRPTTPGLPTSPTNNDDSEYLEMSNSFETYKMITDDKQIVINDDKETDLPPLPTRELKRKMSLSKFCLS